MDKKLISIMFFLLLIVFGCATQPTPTTTTIKCYITSEPSDAIVMAGPGPKDLTFSGLSPRTDWQTNILPYWKRWCYKFSKKGYLDKTVCYNQGLVNQKRYVHAVLTPDSEYTESQEKEGTPGKNIIIPITAKRGTGWIIASDYAVTNYHVVEDCQNVSLIISDGTAIPLKIEIFDKINDIAILSIAENKNKFFQPIPMSEKSSGIGARVFTIGYPYSSAFGVKPKLTDGVISSIYGIQDDPRFYQISVPIQPGNSGGPLVNLRGQAIGMVTSTLDAAKVFNISGTLPQNINYAIKSEYIQILLKTIKKEYQVSTQKEDYKNLEELARKVQDSVFIIDAK